jgi:uncharacterized protein (DUF302 family)
MNSTSHELQVVTYAIASSPPMQSVTRSALEVEGTVGRLKQAVAQEQMWLIHEINPQMLLERGGYAIEPARQLLFFHPRYVARLLASDPAALVEIPLKLVVMQTPDGAVSVSHNDVMCLFGRYPGVAEVAQELAHLVKRIVLTVAEAPP